MNKHKTAFYWLFGFVSVCVIFGAYSSVTNEEEIAVVEKPTCMADSPNQTTRSMYVDGVARCIVEEHISDHQRVAMLGLRGI